MNVDGFVQAVVEDLGRTAAIGDEATARAALLLTAVLDASLRRRLQEALSEAALELTEQIQPDRVDVRVAGSDLQLMRVEGEREQPPPAGAPTGGEEIFSARITLRLPESLKSKLEAAAVAAGVSVNTFIVQSLGRVSEPRPSHQSRGRRLTGYGRS